MAEFVQTTLESMIPELETMSKIELFTVDEVRRITKKRKEFEYKLQRGTKVKEDLMNYISYEWDLLVVIKNKTLSDKSWAPKRNNVAHSVSHHIQNLFSDALTRFGSDVKIWLSYIEFCSQLKLFPLVSRTLDRMLALHQDKPQLFVTAARTEFNVLNNMDRARMFFLHGIRLHKESEILYKESFIMELDYAKKLRDDYLDEKIPEDDPILKGGLAELIYESSTLSVRNVDLVVDFFFVAKKYEFAKALADRIYNDIVEEFKDKEKRWDIVARYTLENPSTELSPKEAVEACVKVYQEAVNTLNTFEMWSLYIKTMLEINEDKTYLKNFKTNCLMKSFLDAHCAEKLEEDHYLKWASLLNGENDEGKLQVVLRSGTECFPKSVRLWERYLKVLALKSAKPGDSKGWSALVNKFDEGVSTLKKHGVNPLSLWRLMINYAQLLDPTKVEKFMLRGIREGGEVSVAVKTLYLEWVLLSKSLKACRKVYSDFASLPPYSLQFHRKMIEFENYAATTDVSKIRNCYAKMTHQFGNEDTKIWIDYVEFEQKLGDPLKVPSIYETAKMKLNKSLVDTFVSNYSYRLANIEKEGETSNKRRRLESTPDENDTPTPTQLKTNLM